jgi:hypothetical protein
VNEASPFF